MANLSSLNSIVEGGNSLQVTPYEQNEAARKWVEFLKPVVDLVVVVTHLGMHEDQDLIRGYEAFYEYGRAKEHLRWKKDGVNVECENLPGRTDRARAATGKPASTWEIREWFGTSDRTDPSVDQSVVRVFIPGVSGIDIVFGGHLHVVLNPPQTLIDPSGRNVLLTHSGAFAKYVGRLDTVVRMPKAGEPHGEGAELVSHDYRAFPLDGLWCDDALRAYRHDNFWDQGTFQNDPLVKEGLARCSALEDRRTTELLQPYILGMDMGLQLTSIFGYAPTDVARRSNSTAGDSPLGNLTADSMRKRRRVEAEMALTNSLGIRDNLYAGPITQEAMFNVFPFENTINIMYLSGSEMQQMLDFVAERSSERGCTSQAQISGARFTMDCAQAQLNALRLPCNAQLQGEASGSDCPQEDRETHSRWQCLQDGTADPSAGRCWAHCRHRDQHQQRAHRSLRRLQGRGERLHRQGRQRLRGAQAQHHPHRDRHLAARLAHRLPEGLLQLRRHQPGLHPRAQRSQRGALRLPGEPRGLQRAGGGRSGQGLLRHGRHLLPAAGRDGRRAAPAPTLLQGDVAACGAEALNDANRDFCRGNDGGPNLGRCRCADALAGDAACGYVTREMRAYCLAPTTTAIVSAFEDGRIGRRLK